MIHGRRAAVALVVLGLAVACNGKTSVRAQPSTAPTESPTATAAPSTTASPRITVPAGPIPTPSARPTEPVGAKDFGYFHAVVDAGPPAKASFDRALFLTGDAANKASAAHGGESPVPNDYYIQNDNKLLRTLTIDPAAKVYGSTELNSFVKADDYGNAPKLHTIEQLLRFIATEAGRRTPFHLVYGAGGRVVRIEEQYVP